MKDNAANEDQEKDLTIRSGFFPGAKSVNNYSSEYY